MRQVRFLRDWEYLPVGPFRLYDINTSTALGDVQHYSDLRRAVAEFARQCLPAQRRTNAYVLDANNFEVIGYYYDNEMPVEWWWGCRATFDLLDELDVANPVDRAGWETRARESAAAA
jgi:hypothetical protein